MSRFTPFGMDCDTFYRTKYKIMTWFVILYTNSLGLSLILKFIDVFTQDKMYWFSRIIFAFEDLQGFLVKIKMFCAKMFKVFLSSRLKCFLLLKSNGRFKLFCGKRFKHFRIS